jgi:uncharacterized protein (TIGR02271 family)
MDAQTIVAVYDTAAHAESAVRDLKAANVPANAISQHTKNGGRARGTSPALIGPAAVIEFWTTLFGGRPDHDTAVYDRSIGSGSTVVTVRVPAEQADQVSAILEQHNPIDLEERAAQYGDGTTTRATAPAVALRKAAAATENETLQLSEENLSVGKRAVSGGTTRVRRYVVETPVEESVTLRTENVSLDRRPVSDARPVADADFSEKTIEMSETSEQAVVAKTARVKEEVSLRKQAGEHTERVRDSVRRDEVEIEQVPAVGASRTVAR